MHNRKIIKLNINYPLLIGMGMIGYFNYIGTSLSGLIQKVNIQLPQRNTILIKMIERFIGLAINCKTIRLQWFFVRKQMIEDLKDDLNGAPIYASNTEDAALAGVANEVQDHINRQWTFILKTLTKL